MVRILYLMVFSVLVFGGHHAVFAAEDIVADAPLDAAVEPEPDERFVSVHDKIKAFTEDFDEASTRHFYALYGSYNLVKVVEDVQVQVGDAIEKCSEVNPDMREALENRYNDWKGEIDGVLDEANGNIDNMIIAQDYAKPRAIRKLMKFIDKKRISKSSDVEKYPVTSPEACEYLRTKMDETQGNLIGLLKSTLVSLPNSLLNADAEEEGAEGEHVHEDGEEHSHDGE